MSIIRRKRQENYTVIPNHIWDDDRLSFHAKGMYVMALCEPEFSMDIFCKKSGLTSQTGSRLLKQLEAAGYCKRERVRHPEKKYYLQPIYHFFDEPIDNRSSTE